MKEWFTTLEAADFLAERGLKIFNRRAKRWGAPSQALVRAWCAHGRFATTMRVGKRYYLIPRSALLSFVPPPIGRPRRSVRRRRR